MKTIIFILSIILCNILNAQTKGYILEQADGYPPEAQDRHWFGSNLTANANHTHDARYKISTVNHIGGWTMNFGVSGADAEMLMDSTGISVIAPAIAIRNASSGLKIVLQSDKIVFTSPNGEYIFDNLPTYADEAAAIIGGVATGAIYKTVTGELRVKL